MTNEDQITLGVLRIPLPGPLAYSCRAGAAARTSTSRRSAPTTPPPAQTRLLRTARCTRRGVSSPAAIACW
jgi:hypothetical protein